MAEGTLIAKDGTGNPIFFSSVPDTNNSGNFIPIKVKPIGFSKTAAVTSGTTGATVQQAAPAATAQLIVDSITVSIAAAASAQTPTTVKLIQDVGGTPVTLWEAVLAAPVDGSCIVTLSDLNLAVLAGKTADLTIGTIVSTVSACVSMSGYTLG